MVLIKQLVQAGYTGEQRIAETYAHTACPQGIRVTLMEH
jgi:hypothetical protein